MRAPPGYADPDLRLSEVRPGYLSPAALKRAGTRASELGLVVTELKEWLQPLAPCDGEITALLQGRSALKRLRLHGMARLAFDHCNVYLNGARRPLQAEVRESIALLCAHRRLNAAILSGLDDQSLQWLLANGAFEIPENH
jgi:hypothetical protein